MIKMYLQLSNQFFYTHIERQKNYIQQWVNSLVIFEPGFFLLGLYICQHEKASQISALIRGPIEIHVTCTIDMQLTGNIILVF